MTAGKLDKENKLEKDEYYKFNFQEVLHLDNDRRVESGREIQNKFVYIFRSVPDKGEKVYKLFAIRTGSKKEGYYFTVEDPNKPKDDLILEKNFIEGKSSTEIGSLFCPVFINGKNVALFVCISQIKLSKNRLKQILKSPEMRCFPIEFSKIVGKEYTHFRGSIFVNEVNGKTEFTVTTFDYIDYAIKLNQKYQRTLNHYEELRHDVKLESNFKEKDRPESKAELKMSEDNYLKTRRMMKFTAGIIMQQIAGKDKNGKVSYDEKLKKSLKDNGEELFSFLRAEQQKQKKAAATARLALEGLINIADPGKNPYFEEVCKDYITEDTSIKIEYLQMLEEAWGDIIERVPSQFEIGRKFVSNLIGTQDPIVGKNGAFDSQNAELVHKISDGTVKVLAALIQSIVTEEKTEKIISHCKSMFLNRFGLEIIEIEEDFSQLRKGSPAQKVYFKAFIKSDLKRVKSFAIADASNSRWNEIVKKTPEIAKNIGFCLDIVSFGLSLRKLYDEKSTQSFLDVSKNSMVLLAFFADRFTEAGKKAALKGSVSFAARANFAASIYDTVVNGMEMAKQAGERDADAAFCKGVETAGSACLAVAGFLTVIGAASSATVLGAPIGLIFLTAGVGLSIAGSVGFGLTDDEPIEIFFQESPWGTKGFNLSPSYNKLVDEINYILPRLYSVNVKSEITKGNLILKIYPKITKKHSRITLSDMRLGRNPCSPDSVVLSDSDPKNCTVINDKQNGLCVTYTIPSQGETNFKAKLQMDVLGDSTLVLPEKGKHIKISAVDYSKIHMPELNTL